MFSTVAAHFTFLPGMYERYNFSTFSLTFIIVRLFYYSHPSACEAVSHCGFELHFPNDYVEHLFVCFLAICKSSLQKKLEILFIFNEL